MLEYCSRRLATLVGIIEERYNMNLLNRLQAYFANRFLIRYLNKNGIYYSSLPRVIGGKPAFANLGETRIGENCMFRGYRITTKLSTGEAGRILIGDRVFLNDGVNIHSEYRVEIGDFTKLGDMVSIYDTSFHPIDSKSVTSIREVAIGNNVWIGSQSIILPGAEVGDNSVIAAGSVVTGSIPSNSLAAGVPAKVVRPLIIDNGWVRP